MIEIRYATRGDRYLTDWSVEPPAVELQLLRFPHRFHEGACRAWAISHLADAAIAVPASVDEEVERNMGTGTKLVGGPGQEARLAALDRALELTPDDARLHRRRAIVSLDAVGRGTNESVIAGLDQALRLEPGHGPALVLRGLLRAEDWDCDGGLADLRQALEGGVADPVVLAYLGDLYLQIGRAQEASAFLTGLIEGGTLSVDLLTIRARAYIELEQAELALADLDAVCQRQWEEDEHRLLRALAWTKLGTMAGALAALEFIEGLPRLHRTGYLHTWWAQLCRLTGRADEVAPYEDDELEGVWGDERIDG